MLKLREAVVNLQPGNLRAELCYLKGNTLYIRVDDRHSKKMVKMQTEFPHLKAVIHCSDSEWPTEPAPNPCPYQQSDFMLIAGLIYRPWDGWRNVSSEQVARNYSGTIPRADDKLKRLAEGHYQMYKQQWVDQEAKRVEEEAIPQLNSFQTQVLESLVSFQGKGDELVKGLRQMGIKVSDSEVKVNFFSKEIVGLTGNLEEWLKSHDAPEQVSNV